MELAYSQKKGDSVLLVEDEDLLARMMALYFEANSYQVESCGDGAMALEWLKTGKFNILVTDLMIPNGSGVELVNWCLQQDVGMRLVVVSGDDVEAAKLLGPEALEKVTVLRKPFHMAELMRCVRSP